MRGGARLHVTLLRPLAENNNRAPQSSWVAQLHTGRRVADFWPRARTDLTLVLASWLRFQLTEPRAGRATGTRPQHVQPPAGLWRRCSSGIGRERPNTRVGRPMGRRPGTGGSSLEPEPVAATLPIDDKYNYTVWRFERRARAHSPTAPELLIA